MQRRLAAILSTDAVGYSRRMAENETATVETLRSHRETIRGLVREYQGRVVDAVGDNLLAEFPSAVDAVACALEVQRLLGERNEKLPENRRLPFRIGLHVGDLLVDGDQIFGDGINVAARLEALADAGGVCASGALVEQVRCKTDADFEDLGEQALKNIPAPVRVWRVRPGTEGGEEKARLTVPGFGGRPAIAVLPFENRTGDPDQEYLADGIVEDVISRLSAFRLFPVIARSSTFTYKGKHIDARQASRDLGARYIVSGSVRKSGSRVRVAVQLVDGASGHQIHAERYDREADDVFDLQDEIVETLAGTIAPELSRAEQQRSASKPTTSLDAWECFQRAYAHLGRHTPEELEEAVRLFHRAIDLDPGFGSARAGLALALAHAIYQGWLEGTPENVAAAMDAGQKAMDLAPEDPRAHEALGAALLLRGDQEIARHALERAINLNPSTASCWWLLASTLAQDRPEEAMAMAAKAIRLSPRDPLIFIAYHICGVCSLLSGREEEALMWVRKALAQPVTGSQTFRLLGALLGRLGQVDEARAALAEATRRAPGFTLTHLRSFNSPALVEKLMEGWRKAGWMPPE